MKRNYIKILIIVFILFTIFFVYQKNNKNKINLETKLITPQLIEDRELENIPLSQELKEVKKEISNILKSEIFLKGISGNYVLFSILNMSGSNDSVFNIATKNTLYFPDSSLAYRIKINNSKILYIATNKIYLYELGDKNFRELLGSKLVGNETYHSGDGDRNVVPVESHTEKNIKLRIFDNKNYEKRRVLELTF